MRSSRSIAFCCTRRRKSGPFEDEIRELRLTIRAAREEVEKRIEQARRADLKLAQLSSLSGESFEEFVAELFEMLEFEVEKVGGSGDQGPTFVSAAATGWSPSFSASITSKAWSALRSSRSSWERFTTPAARRAFL